MRFKLAKLIRSGVPAIGTWMEFFDSDVAQVLANAGFDWVCLDTEHNPVDETQLYACLRTAGGAGLSPVVRVRRNDEALIKLALDCGAEGVVVPGIVDAEDARRAVAFTKYPPVGIRGYGPVRATNFWADKAAYDRDIHDHVLLICQIERKSALEAIGEICQVPGLDAVFIGPADLSLSMGHHGQLNHPDVVAAIRTIVETARIHHKPWGGIALDADAFIASVNQGALLTTLGADCLFMQHTASREVRTAREALAKAGRRREGAEATT